MAEKYPLQIQLDDRVYTTSGFLEENLVLTNKFSEKDIKYQHLVPLNMDEREDLLKVLGEIHSQ